LAARVVSVRCRRSLSSRFSRPTLKERRIMRLKLIEMALSANHISAVMAATAL
jgi:hypothetical protein